MPERLPDLQQVRYKDFDEAFDRLKTQQSPLWLSDLRTKAMKEFRRIGMPIVRELSFPLKEDWIYTDLKKIGESSYQTTPIGGQVDGNTLGSFEFGDNDWHRLVIINGVYSPENSKLTKLPRGTIISRLSDAILENPELVHQHLGQYADYRQSGLTALNTALFEDGLFVCIPDGEIVENPIHVHYVTTESEKSLALQPRTLVVTGKSTNLRLVESYSGMTESFYLTNAVTEISVESEGSIDHYRINREGAGAGHLSTTQFHLESNSHISSFNMTLGGELTRNDTNARLAGERSVVRMNGLYLISGSQHVDNHTAMDHVVPNCNSYEVYKGILGGRSRGVFNGKVFVHQDAQETDAKQLNKNLIISSGATIHTKPQLEIYADQVKCTHGATVGQLNEDQIFYLRSRGLSYDMACQLLTYGFAADLISRLQLDAVRSSLDSLLELTIKDLAVA
tara:strand:- start:159483 stop:160835 length:1353 start_codon:yes stop_codon:yes gene_type:complete